MTENLKERAKDDDMHEKKVVGGLENFIPWHEVFC